MKIAIKDIKPNPYRETWEYPLDESRLQALINSINNTGFWNNILCRKNGNRYELAYGHHRLEALRRIYDKNHIVDIPCQKISDANMIRIMADENVTIYEHDPKVIVETVRVAKEFLESHPDVVKQFSPRTADSGRHYDIRRVILLRFLGSNWSKHKIRSALRVLDQSKPEIATSAPTIGHAEVVADTRLKPKEQKKIVKQIKQGRRDEDGKVRPLTIGETKTAVAKTIAERSYDSQPKEVHQILITADEIKQIIASCQRFRKVISEDNMKHIKPTQFDAALISKLTDELIKTGKRIAEVLGGIKDV